MPIIEWSDMKGWRMVPRKMWVSENFSRISKSRKRFWLSLEVSFFHGLLLLFWVSKFSPKGLGLGFLTRISASRRVSDFTIHHPYMTNWVVLLITVLLSTNHKSAVYMLFYNNISKWLTWNISSLCDSNECSLSLRLRRSHRATVFDVQNTHKQKQ